MFNVEEYWENRYMNGGNSGIGSTHKSYIDFKKNYINKIIKEYNIKSIVELGCGDGNQLSHFVGYEKYVGYDISKSVIERCKVMFDNDYTKSFTTDITDILNKKFDLSLSLDVTYHLISSEMFEKYMNNLFYISDLICLYTTNIESGNHNMRHIKHRCITKYVEHNFSNFKLINRLDYNGFVGFFLYQK